MRIEGKIIASTILSNLKKETDRLKAAGMNPTLSVILVGDDPASLAYIKQKQKAGAEIGLEVVFRHEPATIPPERLGELIATDNADSSIQGLIVQRPIPDSLGDVGTILDTIHPEKDVDGFIESSPFHVPVADAVGEMLRFVLGDSTHEDSQTISDAALFSWLKTKKITVIGRGTTAGSPLLHYFKEHDCATSSIHTKTPNPGVILKESDVIISCVGKHRVVRPEDLKPGVILISVGLFRNDLGKLEGDYVESEIEQIASYYSPTPGGVGPVNVACLMKNCIKACTMKEALLP